MRDVHLWGRGGDPGPILRLMSGSWGLANTLRRKAYKKGFLNQEKAPVPLVSVGNLTVGGNAKTPMCVYLAKEFASRGLSPAVLSRGYGRERSRLRPDPVVVSLGLGPLVPLEFAGDEPYLIARLSSAMVLVSAKRAPAALEAADQGADVLILDDGFQHLGLARDLDIVMIQGENGLGNGHVIPAGPLREPAGAIEDADMLVYVGDGGPPDPVATLAQKKPLFTAKVVASGISSLSDGETLPLDYLSGKRFAAFCGLARPQGFRDTMANLGLAPVAFRAFPDHEPYGPRELRALDELLRFSRSEFLLTTLKDAVKLKGLRIPTFALETGLEPSDPVRLMDSVLGRLGISAK
ncbi:MAG: tetraacyldisaccharide 4'-kinase, partial [Deltaproteobacteria bacterium]|nr:tetraacyldisaccharide 4'-kinase [Deltaproteobacteria bacterium]